MKIEYIENKDLQQKLRRLLIHRNNCLIFTVVPRVRVENHINQVS